MNVRLVGWTFVCLASAGLLVVAVAAPKVKTSINLLDIQDYHGIRYGRFQTLVPAQFGAVIEGGKNIKGILRCDVEAATVVATTVMDGHEAQIITTVLECGDGGKLRVNTIWFDPPRAK